MQTNRLWLRCKFFHFHQKLCCKYTAKRKSIGDKFRNWKKTSTGVVQCAVVYWLPLLQNFTQESLDSGSVQFQILLAAVVATENKAKRLSSVNHTTKTIHHHHHHHHHHNHFFVLILSRSDFDVDLMEAICLSILQ